MIRRHWLTWVLVGVLFLVVGTGLLVKFGMEKARADEILAKFPDRGVPRMNITLNGVTLEEINAGSKDIKYEGNEVTVYEGSEMVGEYGNVRVKGRGNGTWQREKKPYKIRLKNNVDLFGLGKAKDWVLLANSLDVTNIRNDLAFYLEKMLEMKHSFDGRFVELYFNKEYCGLYYLTHAVEISKQSVDLRDPLGILVELDNMYGRTEDYYASDNGDIFVVKDVVKSDMANIAMNDFLSSYNDLEQLIEEKDFDEICKIVDVESFAKYYLLSELTANPDAYWTSLYFYKDGLEDKIHVGPGWDFDLAFANREWWNWMGEDYYSPSQVMIRKNELMTREMYEERGIVKSNDINWYEISLKLSRVFFDLMDLQEFQDYVKEVYMRNVYGRSEELLSRINRLSDILKEAAFEDEAKWGGEGFLQEIDMVKVWTKERFEFFDEMYGKNDDFSQSI